MPNRRKFDVKTEKEAIMAISAGVTYFAIRKPLKTLLVVILLLFGPAYIAFDYFTSYRATIKEAEPIPGKVNYRLSYFTQDDEIIIDGKLYGYSRPGFKAWVLKDVDAILVWDMARGDVRKVEIRGMTKK